MVSSDHVSATHKTPSIFSFPSSHCFVVLASAIATRPHWSTLNAHSGEYAEQIGYDANGNIRTYKRNGSSGQISMDDLAYGYNKDGNGNLTNNRLRHVKDAVADGNYTEDIDNQADDNYTYDAIGNLTADTKEGIDAIDWTVYGKIRRITKHDGTTIDYTYDVTGNRISKTVGTPGSPVTTKTTWYARDAQGNTMAIYTSTGSNLALGEQHLYGSSRLGILNRDINMDAASIVKNYIFERGNKRNSKDEILRTKTELPNLFFLVYECS